MRERLTVCVAQIDLIDSLELGDVLVDYFIIGIIIVSIISRRPLLFVAEERKKNAIFTPFLFFVLSFSLSLSLSLDPTKGKASTT